MTTDEILSIVGDVGTQSSKFGYAGGESPSAVFSSVSKRGNIISLLRPRYIIRTCTVSLVLQVVGKVVGEGGGKKHDAHSMDVDHEKEALVGDANLGFRRTDVDVSQSIIQKNEKDIHEREGLDIEPLSFLPFHTSYCIL